MAAAHPEATCLALPVTDQGEEYAYPERVRFQIAERDIRSYERAAEYINLLNVDAVCLQHEFGIFGGNDGRHILSLLKKLQMPVVTTLHTVLEDPSSSIFETMEDLVELSDRVVIMTERGRRILRDTYGVDEEQIALIPHGIPDVPFGNPDVLKPKCGVDGRFMLLTFGLISPNKGIEHVIRALPSIIAEYPQVVYCVLGNTHPSLLRREGESYRMELERLAESLDVSDHVILHNRFIPIHELEECIGAADIYMTPYLNPAQITSGTLSYAFGTGNAVISTPYWHAQELLADGAGILVPFADPDAISMAVKRLISDPDELHAMQHAAYAAGREMIWSEVARKYYDIFEETRREHAGVLTKSPSFRPAGARPTRLPDFKLDHIERMTDTIGIWQHARHTLPVYEEGYCTDDNARALLAVTLLGQVSRAPAERLDRLATSYLAFLNYAFDADKGRFRNFMGFDRSWNEAVGSTDSHGRALWALGTCMERMENPELDAVAAQLFMQALPAARDFEFPRSWAFTLFGTTAYLHHFPGDLYVEHLQKELLHRLMHMMEENRRDDWPWCEDILTYDNASLPKALLLGGEASGNEAAVSLGLESLKWLMAVQTGVSRCFSPIGSNGWFPRGQKRQWFDQQPIEAQSSVSACLEAYRLTGDEEWYREAQRAFDWFLGRNDLGIAVYDSTAGGCRDALHMDRVNQNQGAESTLAFTMALAEMRLAHHEERPARMPTGEDESWRSETEIQDSLPSLVPEEHQEETRHVRDKG